MTNFEANVRETVEVLNVTIRQALCLEFAAMAGWAHVARNVKAEATAFIGCAHARGELSKEDVAQCFAVLDV